GDERHPERPAPTRHRIDQAEISPVVGAHQRRVVADVKEHARSKPSERVRMRRRGEGNEDPGNGGAGARDEGEREQTVSALLEESVPDGMEKRGPEDQQRNRHWAQNPAVAMNMKNVRR